jgi:hypothetical protein
MATGCIIPGGKRKPWQGIRVRIVCNKTKDRILCIDFIASYIVNLSCV